LATRVARSAEKKNRTLFPSSPYFSSLPLEVGLRVPSLPLSLSLRNMPLKIQLGVWGSAVSSPSGVCGGAPAEIEFGAF